MEKRRYNSPIPALAEIPVVDFDGVFSCADLTSCPQTAQIHSAFTTVGFVFIKNHGIHRKLVDDAFSVSRQFFTLPREVKMKYLRCYGSGPGHTGNNGYVCQEQENTNENAPGDLKECYNICAYKTCLYPTEELPQFQSVMTELFEECSKVALKILEVMGYSLGLLDPLFFVKAHQKIGQGIQETHTTMRPLYYPPLPPRADIQPGQLRCGEHVDFNSITLLFQDPNGGLQVKRSDGGYIDVPYMSDAVLVNLGNLMQQWTSNKYLATPHRVLLPDDEVKWRTVRQSLAFFVHPDNEVMVECFDGSNKYPPITARENVVRKLKATYFY